MEEKFSYSKLDTYVQCPFQFKLKYIDDKNFRQDSLATMLGTAIHECEEEIAKAIRDKVEINYTALKNKLIIKLTELEFKFNSDFNERDKSLRTTSEKLYYYLDNSIYNLEKFMQAHPTYEIVGIEEPFNIEYKGKLLHGYIDRVFHDTATDTYLIQDIKTYAVEVDSNKLATPLQFVVYTLAVKELYKCEESQISCQYYLPFCNLTQDAGTTGYMVRGENKLEKLFNSIAEESFAPSPSPLCNWCTYCATNPNAPEEGKYLCPYFSLWERNTRNKQDIKKVKYAWEGLENHERIMECYTKSIAKEVK